MPALPIPWSANAATLAANIQTALNKLVPPQVVAGIGNTDVITFSFNGFQSTLLTLGANNLTGAGATPVLTNVNGSSTTRAVQTLSLTGTVTGGTFNLVYGSQPPVTVTWLADPGVLAANIQNAGLTDVHASVPESIDALATPTPNREVQLIRRFEPAAIEIKLEATTDELVEVATALRRIQ